MKSNSALLCSLAVVVGCSAEVTSNDGEPTDSVGTVVSPLSASIILQNRAIEHDLNLLARIEVQPDELLEFYEPHPGVIWISTAGAPESPRFVGKDLDAAEEHELSKPEALWKAATDRAMPASLAGGIARANERLARGVAEQAAKGRNPALGSAAEVRPKSASTPSAPQTAEGFDGALLNDSSSGVSGGSGSGNWCDSNWWTASSGGYGALSFCPDDGGYWTTCWDHVTGPGSAWHSEVYFLRTNVCPYSGNVTFKVSADESFVKQGSWTVSENTFRGVHAADRNCDMFPFTDDCVYVKSEVTNASGDAYNYRFVVFE